MCASIPGVFSSFLFEVWLHSVIKAGLSLLVTDMIVSASCLAPLVLLFSYFWVPFFFPVPSGLSVTGVTPEEEGGAWVLGGGQWPDQGPGT